MVFLPVASSHSFPIFLQAVADIIRTTLGPRSMLKMLLDPMGGIGIPPSSYHSARCFFSCVPPKSEPFILFKYTKLSPHPACDFSGVRFSPAHSATFSWVKYFLHDRMALICREFCETYYNLLNTSTPEKSRKRDLFVGGRCFAYLETCS